MNRKPFQSGTLTLLLMLILPILGGAATAQDTPPASPPQVDMAEMMARARQYTTPGPHHEVLKRFLGDWDTELRVTMPGINRKPDKGTARITWLMDGYWIQCLGEGTLMGRPTTTFTILGYDNFKQSYRMMTVSTADTAMLVSEGDMDPGGKALLTYGTLDEYLTGEHDKMVKYIWRFLSDDEMVLEIYDLPIGEKNNQVLELRYRRHQPDAAGGQP